MCVVGSGESRSVESETSTLHGSRAESDYLQTLTILRPWRTSNRSQPPVGKNISLSHTHTHPLSLPPSPFSLSLSLSLARSISLFLFLPPSLALALARSLLLSLLFLFVTRHFSRNRRPRY